MKLLGAELRKEELLAQADPELANVIRNGVRFLGGVWVVCRVAATDAEQTALYAKGRTEKGEPPYTAEKPMGLTVTQARLASETAHGVRAYGACAVDVLALSADGRAVVHHAARYRALGEYCKARGYDWGGDFKRRNPKTGQLEAFPDLGHFQVRAWRKVPLRLPDNPEGVA